MCTLIEIQPKRRLFAIAFFVDRGEEGRGIARQKLKYSHEMQIGENTQQLTSSVIRVDPSLRRVRLPLFVHTAANPYRVNRSNIFDRERFRNSSRRNDQTRAFVTKQQLSREISWKIIEGEREREKKREKKKRYRLYPSLEEGPPLGSDYIALGRRLENRFDRISRAGNGRSACAFDSSSVRPIRVSRRSSCLAYNTGIYTGGCAPRVAGASSETDEDGYTYVATLLAAAMRWEGGRARTHARATSRRRVERWGKAWPKGKGKAID